MKKNIIFLCTHNSARSQMAEGILRHLYGDKFEVHSAGTYPTSVNKYAINFMKELDIDISKHRAKSIEEFRDMEFDLVVTVCDDAKEAWPFFPGEKVIHKGFEDPSDFRGTDHEMLIRFRQTGNEIKKWIEDTFG